MPVCDAKTGSGGGGSSCSEAGVAVVVAPATAGPGQAQGAPWGVATSAAERTMIAGQGPGSASTAAASGFARVGSMRRSPSGTTLAGVAAAPANGPPPVAPPAGLTVASALAPPGLPPAPAGVQPGASLLPAVQTPAPQVPPGLPLAPQMGLPHTMAAFPGMHYGFMPGYTAGYTLEQLGMLHSMTAAACFPYPAAALYQARSVGLAGAGASAMQASAPAPAPVPGPTLSAGCNAATGGVAGAAEGVAAAVGVKQEPGGALQAPEGAVAQLLHGQQQHVAVVAPLGDPFQCRTLGKQGHDEGEVAAPHWPQQQLSHAPLLVTSTPQHGQSTAAAEAVAIADRGRRRSSSQHGTDQEGVPSQGEAELPCDGHEWRRAAASGAQGPNVPSIGEAQGQAPTTGLGSLREQRGDQQPMVTGMEGCPGAPLQAQGTVDVGAHEYGLGARGVGCGGGAAGCGQMEGMEGEADAGAGACDAGAWTVAQVNAWLHTIGAEVRHFPVGVHLMMHSTPWGDKRPAAGTLHDSCMETSQQHMPLGPMSTQHLVTVCVYLGLARNSWTRVQPEPECPQMHAACVSPCPGACTAVLAPAHRWCCAAGAVPNWLQQPRHAALPGQVRQGWVWG